jgi:hypothetical protein
MQCVGYSAQPFSYTTLKLYQAISLWQHLVSTNRSKHQIPLKSRMDWLQRTHPGPHPMRRRFADVVATVIASAARQSVRPAVSNPM